MGQMHKVIRAEVVKLVGNDYAVRFEFDDGSIMHEPVGPKATAEFYAREQLWEICRSGSIHCC